MSESVHILGDGRTDFKRNFKKEGKTIRDIVLEAARAAVEDAHIAPSEIQSGVVGNFASGQFTGQLHLGAFLTELDPKLRGIPTLQVGAACASGAVAVLTAAQQIIGGQRDVVLVVGAEQQKTMPPAEGADVLAAAADYHAEKPQFGEFMFPKLFARIAQIYMQRYGLTEQQLAQVAVKNRRHARANPHAQLRDAPLTLAQACAESPDNPRIAPPLKLTDCSPITDGGAALVLCSERFAKKLARKPLVRLLGYGHTTDHLSLDRKDVPDFSIARRAAEHAYAMANLTPRDIHGAEVHDCFSISEILAYELLGFAERGKGARLLEGGAHAIPVNLGGGLLADGHPVGATGVRQVVEAYRRLTTRAGAKRYLTFNIGGSFTTNVVMIWGAAS